MPELGLFQWIIGGVIAGGIAIAAYLNGRVSSTKSALNEVEKEQLRLRNYVAETYSTKADVNTIQSQTQHTLDRLHSRIDDMGADIKALPQQILSLIKK
jgi:septal ring factor EnvC (AmiA/AmiB activator)